MTRPGCARTPTARAAHRPARRAEAPGPQPGFERAGEIAFAESASMLSVAAFAGDGTLYVADWASDRLLTVTADGEFTPFYVGLDAPDGLAIAPDGTRMFVAHRSGSGRIDQLSIPGATLTPGIAFELSPGAAPTGIVVDGDNHVLYEMPLDAHAVVDVFAAP